MEVELRKSEVSALAELKDLCRHECTAERCADAVREFGWSLEHVPENMKTPEMCRRALEASAELGYGHLALLHHIPLRRSAWKPCGTGTGTAEPTSTR